MSRTKNSVRNAFFTVMGSVVIMVLQLVNRKVFVNFLADEYLGLNGLFSNILSMLSMSEMGIGTAMIFSLYQPVGENNTEKIKSLMRLYKKLYTIIGWFVLGMGFAITPFLRFFIKEMPDIPYIHLYFMMYVLNSGISYFYTYKRSIIICNQEDYISSLTTMGASVATRVVQLIFLIATHNYFLFLLTQIVFTRLENVIISKIADKKYPYLLEKEIEPLSSEDTASIKKNIYAMMTQKIGSVIVSSTDNLIISKILGLTILGFYSNYTLILNTLNSLIVKVFNSITASVGNLVVKGSKEETETTFRNMYKIILTASGGPFLGKKREELQHVLPQQALKHPNWSMGSKVTIDSATMMNKGLEMIEAKWLFNLQPKEIEIVVHPQSIVHSLVHFADGSVKAQMALPDMRLPIQYALSFPQRLETDYPKFDLTTCSTLTFYAPDRETFSCIDIAYQVIAKGGNMPCVMNAANEIAVDAFLHNKIRFPDIAKVIGETMARVPLVERPGYNDYVATNAEARQLAEQLIVDLRF